MISNMEIMNQGMSRLLENLGTLGIAKIL